MYNLHREHFDSISHIDQMIWKGEYKETPQSNSYSFWFTTLDKADVSS